MGLARRADGSELADPCGEGRRKPLDTVAIAIKLTAIVAITDMFTERGDVIWTSSPLQGPGHDSPTIKKEAQAAGCVR
jgi:hypothetical protein